MSCQPPYDYRPYTRPVKNAQAPTYPEHRSRLFAGGTYFRSIDQKQSMNDISLEVTNQIMAPNDFTLNVRYRGNLVETYTVTQVPDMMMGR